MRKKILMVLVLLLLSMSALVQAANYYVATAGADTNAGTEALPFRTIQRCANVAVAGDTCYVRAGTYNERASISRSGTASAFINFVGHPLDAKPVMRGFSVSANYIRIIGFEITHINTQYEKAVSLGSSNHVEILNNYIHHISGEGGAIGGWAQLATYVTIRGNEIDYLNCIPGLSCMGNGWAAESGFIAPSRWLIEYNHIRRAGDYVNLFGSYHIVRNNYMHDFRDSYFDAGAGGNHVDFFQPGSAGYSAGVHHHVYESNVLGDNIELNSHILQMRDTVNGGDHDIVFRGNVGYNVGAYALQAGGVDNVKLYNNAYYKMLYASYMNGEAMFWYNSEGGNPSTGNYNFNNIMQDISLRYPSSLIIAEGSNTVTASNNLCYSAGSHSSCASTSNPLFVSAATNDFHLQAGSPAIGIGKAISTVTSSSGSGTSFNVDDASFFCDGYGVADGDLIKVGSNAPVRITSISANTITVDSSITWNGGDGVYWRNQDTSPDAGAYEYRSGGYNYGISISSPANNAAVSGSVNIATTPTNPELIRQVIFYIDGVPVNRDFSSPFSFTWSTSGLTEGSSHVIEAVAYPLYATTDLWASSKITVSVGSGTQPLCTDADWSYADGVCQPTNTLTRTWTKTNANCQGGVSHPATEPVACVYVPPAIPGDLNGDGLVNSADFFIIVSDFGKTSGFNNAKSDTNADNIIDIYDVVYVASRFT